LEIWILKLGFKNMKSNLDALEGKLGIKFNSPELLKEALTHRSYLNENPSWPLPSNERLEFLGDAVLELAVTEELFKRFPKKEEGELTVYRAALVNTRRLREVAGELGIDKAVLVSKGEARGLQGRGGEAVLADVVEAMIGAIYLDGGYGEAKKFIRKFVLSYIDKVVENGGKDSKSIVQEIVQEKHGVTPTYKVLEESGPAHDRAFRVGLYIGENMESEGKGNSKQEAELDAANKLLKRLRD
jgi:ribonuclease-3